MSDPEGESSRLFVNNPIRTTFSFALALGAAHLLTRVISWFNAFQITQTSLAVLGIASLMMLVVWHHRRPEHRFNQTQEEMILIVGMGLFWLAVLISWNSWGARGGGGGSSVGHHQGAGRTSESQSVRDVWDDVWGKWPCRPGDRYCEVEEWYGW